MTIEDRVAALFAEANPVPSLDLLDEIEPVDIDSLADRSERSGEMTDDTTGRGIRTKGQAPGRRWLVIGGAAAAFAIAIALGVFTTRAELASTPVGKATAFWEAVANDDREAAIGYLDPVQVESGVVGLFGRAHTIEGQFEWYEAVGFRWALDRCVETAGGNIECTVTARNDWSEAIGVEPVSGTYFMEFGPDGIRNIVENNDSFTRQWLPDVFDVFNRWVEIHHPEDVPVMWNDQELTPEGLELFRVNTARFVEAYPSE